MQCSKCKNPAIVSQPYSGQHLCQDHFIVEFEAKAKRAIRKTRGMQPGDHIAVILRGDGGSGALFAFFQKLAGKRHDIRISGIRCTGTGDDGQEIAQEAGATRLAFATSLEEASSSALVSFLRGEAGCFGTNAPALPRVTPFSHIPEQEIAIYARITGAGGHSGSIRGAQDPFTAEVRVMLAAYTERHPAAPHAVLGLAESLEHAFWRRG